MSLKEHFRIHHPYPIAPQVNNMATVPYYNFDALFSPEECETITGLAEHLKLSHGTLGAGDPKDDRRLDLEYRDVMTDVFPIRSNTKWIYDRISEAVQEANDTAWNFDIQGIFEGIQFMEYKDTGHYDWHMDQGVRSSSCRKLTVSIQLSDPDEYEGCELEIFPDRVAGTGQGQTTIFPSTSYHRVTKLTRGARRCLVAWIMGPPLR